MPGAGLSGMAVGIITTGGFLVYTGIKNVPIQDGLRQILRGQAITEGPQTRSDISAPASPDGTTPAPRTPGPSKNPSAKNSGPTPTPPVNGTTLDKFLHGLGIQESGGSGYGTVNSIGAVGKYQILKSNIPRWSQEALGHSITWQQFRDSPQLQEQIVRHKVSQYISQFGLRGAAAAWYAGPKNANLSESTRPQPGGPPIKSYVDSVLRHAGLM